MGEISEGKDVSEIKQPEAENYKEIRPEGESDPATSKQFIDDLFSSEIEDGQEKLQNPRQEVVDGKTYYYDVNGKLYRVENNLVPNCQYEMNGYTYTTDEQGRISLAEGTLHMKDREGRLPIKDSIEDIGKGDQKEGDDRGHLIGDQFDGSNGLEKADVR